MCFYCLVIYCCNKASNRIVPKQKELVSSGYPLSPEVSRLSPYTHAHINIHELQEPSTYSQYTGGYTPSEEARAAPTEEHALQLRGTDFYLPFGGAAQDFRKKVLESPHCHRTGKPRRLHTNR